MKQRISRLGSITVLSLGLWLGVSDAVRAQDRAGAAMAGAAGQVPPPPGPGMPPPRGGGEGGGIMPPGPPPIPGGALPPAAGGIGIGTIPVTPPPPIGYYAPVRAVDYNMGKFFYYPFYYFPHSYWPTQSCPWPERPGQPYMRPPGYMSYPPFLEPHWRYEWYVPQKYYRGFHFWLDQF